MNISGLTNALATAAASRTKDTTRTAREPQTTAASGVTEGDNTSLSEPAQLFGKLAKLAKFDPKKAKEIFGKLADAIEKASSGGSDDGPSAPSGAVQKKLGAYTAHAKSRDEKLYSNMAAELDAALAGITSTSGA